MLCGCLSIVFALEGNLIFASFLIFIATIFDFLDGMAARLLKVQSELGKQLDSLADMVTFGVAPGMILYKFYTASLGKFSIVGQTSSSIYFIIPVLAFLIPLLSGLRLAKFNVDDSQTSEFKGLATPANALFWAGTILAFYKFKGLFNGDSVLIDSASIQIAGVAPYDVNGWHSTIIPQWILITCALNVLMSLLLVAPIRMFSFKFKSLQWKDNEIRYVFIAISLLTVVGSLLINNIYLSVPIIILLYIITSMVYNLIRGK